MKLDWTERALIDLATIDRWLSEHADKDVAEVQIDRIRERARKLRDFPRTGPQINAETRSVSVPRTSYILIYRVLVESVEILRIRHAREDWREGE